MKTKLCYLVTLFVIFCVSLGYSQNHKITGTVTSSNESMPLTGVNVLVKGTLTGAVTDYDGKFTLTNVSPTGILVLSYVGYKTIEVAFNTQKVLSISMEEDASQLDEVVIVGYGTQKKENLTGSISTVKLEDDLNRPIANATQALAGKAAGVTVTQTSGNPGGDGATIKIRGIGTLGNSNPLVLIDGIRGSLGNVNVADIETITVLKDAASAAIYGARAANGVLLVTTKTGKSGKMTVSYNGYTGIQKPTKLTEYVTNSVEFMELLNQAKFNEDPASMPDFSESEINEFRNGTDPYLYPNTDWQNVVYRDAQIITHNFSVRGGNDKTTYSFSVGHTDQDGIVLGTNTKQYTARLNLDTKVSDKFNYSLKLSGRYDDVNQPVAGAGAVIGWVERATPMQSPRLEDGSYAYPWIGFPNATHALAGALEGKNRNAWDNLLINLSGEYELIQDLKLKSSIGINTYHNLHKVFRPQIDLINPKTLVASNLGVGGNPLSAWNGYTTGRTLTLLSTLNYNKTIAENHNFTLLGGFSQESTKTNHLSASKNGLPSNALQEIDAGADDPAASGYSVDYGLQSFFGRFNYDFNSKYLLEANVRYDGSSNFGPGNKWGVFPSFSAGWNISNEGFMGNVTFIDDLKLRASWGQLGNQAITPNQYSSIYNLGGIYSYGGNLVGGAAQTSLPNPDVTWETSTQTDIGFDISMFGRKLNIVADYYLKDTEDILRSINISTVVGGLIPPTVNLASVRNKGFEFLVDYNNAAGEFEYGVSVNFTTIDNEVTKLPTPQIGGFSRIVEGSSINEFYTIKMLGIFQNQAEIDAHGAQPTAQPGDIKFEDFDDSGDIGDGDRQAMGSSIPKLTYGFNVSAAYKGFDFSMLWQGVDGINAITEEEQKPFFNSAGIPKFWVENAWTPEKPNNNYPRLVRASNYLNNMWRNSSFLIQDASFLRLKNIQLGYSLPQRFLEKIKIDKLRFYVNATNPITITDYRGLDPEKNPFGNRGSYSNVQVYSLGLNLSL
ncbi:TonB-dependent receptor [Cellulophaga sp. F20128]|uniref:SusC/RagA family TonB-linked outer membrane protein n=1 Tax=Cellulophaga sp. F20128 TaxID=2926413 RepID=UPI001FF64C1B|nr:TonB-dependent receptor [Cellulophaga sp. F20128]MCK0158252.1 TonB-dependent receptor [Cellulophaga sp. F20128]